MRQRELGVRLRQLRHDLGLTVEDVARRVALFRDQDQPDRDRRATAESSRRTRSVPHLPRDRLPDGSGRPYGSRPTGEGTRLVDAVRRPRHCPIHRLGARSHRHYYFGFSMYWVPPLLQTEDYARAIISGIAPKIDPKIRDERIEALLLAASSCWSRRSHPDIEYYLTRPYCTAKSAAQKLCLHSSTKLSCASRRNKRPL